jgi:hypothetical protein
VLYLRDGRIVDETVARPPATTERG